MEGNTTMTNVWIVTSGEYSNLYIKAAFDTEEAATAYADLADDRSVWRVPLNEVPEGDA